MITFIIPDPNLLGETVETTVNGKPMRAFDLQPISVQECRRDRGSLVTGLLRLLKTTPGNHSNPVTVV